MKVLSLSKRIARRSMKRLFCSLEEYRAVLSVDGDKVFRGATFIFNLMAGKSV